MTSGTSDAYARTTRGGERRIRTGPFAIAVRGGWVGATRSQTSKVASYRSTPVTTYESVEHYRDSYAVYGADPSLPDAVRSLETTRVHTGRDTWTEEQEHVRYESEFDGYRDVTTTWRDISWDGGGRTRSRWHVARPGHRVYHVGVSVFGRMLHSRLYDAVDLQWERPPAFGWRAFRRKATDLIAADVAAWRDRAWRVAPGGVDFSLREMACFDGTVAEVQDGTAIVRTAKGRRGIAGKPGFRMDQDDFLLLARASYGDVVVAIHNVTTGGTWHVHGDSSRPSPKTVLREHRLTIAAGIVGVVALCIGLRDHALQHLTAPVVLAAIAAGYLLGQRATDRLAGLRMRSERVRRDTDDVVSCFRTIGWKGIRNLPAGRAAPRTQSTGTRERRTKTMHDEP